MGHRHGPLLMTACKLLKDLPKAHASTEDAIETDEAEFDCLIELLMKPAVTLLEQAETSDFDGVYGVHMMLGIS